MRSLLASQSASNLGTTTGCSTPATAACALSPRMPGARRAPRPGKVEPPPTGARQYLLTSVSDDSTASAQETIEQLLGNGEYVFGERTAGRKQMKPGDLICSYQSGKGVVAEAEVASHPERRVVPYVRNPEKYPWAFRVRAVRYFFDVPVVLDAVLRARLDAFAGGDSQKPWAWFVQSSGPVSAYDFAQLTRREGAGDAAIKQDA
jgi:hypothetical protein